MRLLRQHPQIPTDVLINYPEACPLGSFVEVIDCDTLHVSHPEQPLPTVIRIDDESLVSGGR
jgi:hypothetical protein